MSLFKVRDWWSTKCGIDEEFDRGCLCVGNVDNQRTNQSDYCDKIVTGSFSGLLRIYKPQKNKFQVADLLLEQQLEQPILQIELGRFMAYVLLTTVSNNRSSQSNALAILMPRKLAVYSVSVSSSSSSSSSRSHSLSNNDMESSVDNSEEQSGISQCELTKLYEHELPRLAYNFTFGPFGGAYAKDFLCVQSFDGQLAFYEQDHFVFARFMSDTLLPGPIVYNKNTDSFITYNSNMELESYKYQVLATSTGSNEKDSESSNGKKIQVDWSLNLGEEVVDIQIARYSQNLSANQNEIIVLGNRTLYSIKENGRLAAQKRLDFFPSTLCIYNQSQEKSVLKHNIIVGTHSRTVMVFKDPKLLWAAGTSIVPVSLKLGTFGRVPGMMVLLDDQGNMSVNYLGTDAVSNPVPTMESKEIDYCELEEEHQRLQALIRQTQNAGKYEPVDKLLIRAQVPNSIDQEQYGSASERKKVTVKLYLGYTGDNVSITNICLNINVQPPFSVAQSNIEIETLKGGSHRTPVIVPITVYGGSDVIPITLKAEVLAVFNSPTGELRTTTCEFLLPLSLAGDVISSKKAGTIKITIDTNRMPPPMEALFEDVLYNIDADKTLSGGSALTFKYSNGQDATILVSKTSGRYRIQSNDLETLWILTSELIRRVDTYFLNENPEDSEQAGPYLMQFSENLPFQQYFQKIDHHFERRLALKHLKDTLGNLTQQLRVIQKRLLIRYKDKNPTPINNLDILFDQTYESIIQLSKEVEKSQRALDTAGRNLSCSTSLILALLKLKLNLPEQEITTLRQYLTPDMVDNEEQGWEELTDVGMTFLLRTTLAKNSVDNSTMPTSLEMPKDTSKLKKHIAQVYDRISKGMSLSTPKEKKKKKKRQNQDANK